MRRKHISRYTIVGALTCLALLLRVSHLTDSAWYDEIITYYMASLSFEGVLEYLHAYSVHPPFYYFVIKLWNVIFGHDIVQLRVLSTVFGVLSIPLCIKLTTELFDRTTGYFSGAILAVSPFHIYYSQELRSYALFGLLVLLSFLCYLYLARNPASRKRKLWYFASVLVLGYTHVFGLVAILTQFVHALALAYRDRSVSLIKSVFIVQVTFAVCFVPWVPSFLNQVYAKPYWAWIPESDLSRIFYDTFNVFANNFGIVNLVLWIALISGFVLERKRPKHLDKQTKDSTLLLWMVFPLLLLWGFHLIGIDLAVSRYLFQVFLFHSIVVAFAFSVFYKAHQKPVVKRFVLAVFMLFITVHALQPIVSGNTLFQGRSANWKNAISTVSQGFQKGDLIVGFSTASVSPEYAQFEQILSYYWKESPPPAYAFNPWSNEEMPVDKTTKRIWLFGFSFQDVEQFSDEVHEEYFMEYQQRQVYSDGKIEIILLEKT